MANVEYVTENKLTIEANEQGVRGRKIIFIFGGVLAVAALFVHLYLSFFLFFIILILCLFQNGSQALRAGAVGEDTALAILKNLPDTFTIYNQVDIPNQKSKTGFNEADIIVVGPSAIFVIEVKHNNGSITGSETEKEWSVDKVGRGGTAYSKTMRSPIAQVKQLVWLLSENMKKNKARAWIQGVVLFSNDKALVSISQPTSIPVLANDELLDYIVSYEAKKNISNINKVNQSIAKLKTI